MGPAIAILLLVSLFGGIQLWSLWLDAGHPQGTRCYKNLRQIGVAALMYAATHQGVFPDSLETAFLTEGLSAEVFTCPSGPDVKATGATQSQIAANIHAGGHCSYIYVGANLTSSSPATSIVAFDFPTNHAMDGGSVLYADGHTEFVMLDKLVQLVPMLEAGQNPPTFAALSETQAKTLYAQRWLPQLTAMQSGQWEKKVTNQPTTQPVPAARPAVP